jgi:hypothetical protein
MLAELAALTLLLAAPGERAVPCAESIQTVAFPHVGGRDYPAQQVLGAVSAPGKHVPQSSETGQPPWTYFGKWGLVVRGGPGADVVVSVPRAWRNRVAISWGNAQHRVFHTLRFDRCGEDARKATPSLVGSTSAARAAACRFASRPAAARGSSGSGS